MRHGHWFVLGGRQYLPPFARLAGRPREIVSSGCEVTGEAQDDAQLADANAAAADWEPTGEQLAEIEAIVPGPQAE